MAEFLEGECGGPSASISYASHFTRDRGFKDEGLQAPVASQEVTSNQLVSEFLDETLVDVCSPFHMGSLLNQMQAIEQGSNHPLHASSQWSQEFTQTASSSSQPSLPSTHSGYHNHAPFELEHKMLPSYVPLMNLDRKMDPTDAFRNAASEFLEMANQRKDTKLLQTSFAEMMKVVAGDCDTSGELSDDSTIEINADVKTNAEECVEDWMNQFVQERQNEQHRNDNNWSHGFPGTEKEFWDKMAAEWEKISGRENVPWLSDFYDYTNMNKVDSCTFERYEYYKILKSFFDLKYLYDCDCLEPEDYNFTSENPMENMVNALEEGQKRLQKGDLPGAVLCFEAAVKQHPDNPLAWQLLGTTQAENEQDVQAIAALTKCVSLDQNNLIALMALAVSYTNESYQNQACKALKEWIRVNPSYSDLVKTDIMQDDRTLSSLMSKELYDEVKNLFLDAARRNPQNSIDADVQTGLSVLFNLSGEPNLAADCCAAALSVRPDDWRLWNRLGATLANGGRSEEAVDAYRNALELSPGFIRARYNLGITCIHLRAYREAAEHLLIALNQQVSGVGLQGEPSAMSDTIWTTLRLVISLLERPDLMPEVNNRDLTKLNEAFNIN